MIIMRRPARAAGLAVLALGLGWTTSASALERNVDPETLPPGARAFALHGPLGDYGPTGRPAAPGCVWSRLQIPTAQGLRWVAHEECNPEFGPT